MGLACYCDDDGDWFHSPPDDYSTLPDGQGTRCCSCMEKIAPGDTVNAYSCWRYPESDEEEDEFGDEVPLDTLYHCETCADIYWNLEALGFCMFLADDMRALMKEYRLEYVRNA